MELHNKTRLSDSEMQALISDYLRTKDVELRDRIINQYRNLVESIGRRFTGSGEPLDDLVQEGYIGLITAADLYNEDKGVKFSTYATHFIIGQIKHALRDRGKMIKEPAWLQELNHRMLRVIESLSQELGRHPTDAEIARIMHLPEETVREMMTTQEVFKVSSLDADTDESSTQNSIANSIKDEKYTVFQLPVEDKVVLETAMNKLKTIEQKVIQDFYYSGLTQTEIAKKLGISCNYVSHILRSGTKKLRRILTTDELTDIQIQTQLANRRSPEENAHLDETVVDALTGLYNRQYIESRLVEELIRATREKFDVAFAVVKIKGLEEFGAKFGTMRRDDLALAIGKALKDTIRKCDIVGRLDTSIFALILPHTGDQARIVCARVKKLIAQVQDNFCTGKLRVEIPAYIGYSTFPGASANASELISNADMQAEMDIPESRAA